jgi:hypothetical protein
MDNSIEVISQDPSQQEETRPDFNFNQDSELFASGIERVQSVSISHHDQGELDFEDVETVYSGDGFPDLVFMDKNKNEEKEDLMATQVAVVNTKINRCHDPQSFCVTGKEPLLLSIAGDPNLSKLKEYNWRKSSIEPESVPKFTD